MSVRARNDGRYLAYMALAGLLVLVFFIYGNGGLSGSRGMAPDGGQKSFPGFPVNINSAGVQTLVLLPGIGPKRAEAIIAERERRGGFARLSDIQDVRGIGKRRFEAIKDFIIINQSGGVEGQKG
ncbi:MAG: ComEA family DNA-binding protein [Thermodesulfobacteriota bacterium]